MITLSKMALDLTVVLFVERPPVIGVTLGNMLKTFTFPAHFLTPANIAMRPSLLETC